MKKFLFLVVFGLFFVPSAYAADCTSGYVLSPNDLQTYNADGTACDVVESSGEPSNAGSGSFGGTGTNYRTDGTQGAQGSQFVPLAPIPGLTQGVTADSKGLADFLNNLYKYLVGLGAIIAVVEIILGGIDMATKDSVPLHMKGKERIQQALVGLLLLLSPALVFSIINPAILNLSVNLPALDTKPANYQIASSTQNLRTTGGFRPTTSSETQEVTIIPCPGNDCSPARKACLANTSSRNAGDATVVCVSSDGSVVTEGSTCEVGKLSIQCTLFGGTKPGPLP